MNRDSEPGAFLFMIGPRLGLFWTRVVVEEVQRLHDPPIGDQALPGCDLVVKVALNR